MDYVRYYSLEAYLFEVVSRRFHDNGCLSAFDFFSIVVWKANRAKSKIAQRLLERAPGGHTALEPICEDLTRALHAMRSNEDRMKLLMQGHGFRLPMASAILTVLWPASFSVYDVRVCSELGAHHSLANRMSWNSIWTGYLAYLEDVRRAAPSRLHLRDKDRFLWGRSAARQLRSDIDRGFARTGQ